MKTWWLIPLGAILAFFGIVWTLQGLDIVGGSAMSGNIIWAVIGPIVALVGVAFILMYFRGSRRSSS